MSKNSFHDLIMDMMKAFDPNVVPSDLIADIQFHVIGKEPGDYFLHIENGKCTLQEGVSKSPKATIKTPSEVWIAIIKGEIDGQKAFFEQKFTLEGDLMLLLQLRNMFKIG